MKTIYNHRKKIMFVPLIIAGIFLFVFITMTLWNALLPEIFSLPVINFWQAAGLVILTRLLFGFGHHSNRRKWSGQRMDSDVRSKIKNMSSEEKKEFFKKMHYNREMWNQGCYEGKEQKQEEKSGE